MTAKQLTEQIQSLLLNGDAEGALGLLISGLAGSRQRREHSNARLLKAKWEGVKQEQLKGIISRQEYELACNKVLDGIQTIINEIDQGEEDHPARKDPSAGSLRNLVIVAGIICIIGIGIWYLINRQPDIAVDPVPQELSKTPSSGEKDQESPEETTNTKTNASPTNDGVPQSTSPQKTNIAPPVNEAENPKTQPPKEIKTASLTILLNDEARLKIDGKAISGSGVVKVDLSLGDHKFEITEGNQRCVQQHEIKETTKRLPLSCNN